MLLILERLDFEELLRVAEINDKMSDFAVYVYRVKYSHYIAICDYTPYSEELEQLLSGREISIDTIERIIGNRSYIHNKQYVRILHDHIHFEDLHAMLTTFKYFGHEITKVEYRGTKRPWQNKLIAVLINGYSSESLVDIVFGDEPNAFLNHIKNPLINIENVTFVYSEVKFVTPTVRFIELFPAVRRLDVNRMCASDMEYFDYHMPHLEHAYISGRDLPVPGLIVKNPQIRGIESHSATPEFLQELNTLLPQLETLKLVTSDKMGETVRFENVTTFETTSSYINAPLMLHFPRIQCVHIEGKELHFPRYLEFLNRHLNLSHLHLKLESLDSSEFQQLTENLKDIVELTLECPYYRDGIRTLNPNDIMDFVGGHDKLMKINVINFADRWNSVLEEQLGHGWRSTVFEMGIKRKCTSFKRKFAKAVE